VQLSSLNSSHNLATFPPSALHDEWFREREGRGGRRCCEV